MRYMTMEFFKFLYLHTLPLSRKMENVGNLEDLLGMKESSNPFLESLRYSISNSSVVPRVKLYATSFANIL